MINSYVSECKAIGQDSQAISGFNGPGNYLIENNYLEGATENVLFGGADPTIPNLVTSNITFRRNYLRKPLAWRDPIIATPAAVAAIGDAGRRFACRRHLLLQGRGARQRGADATRRTPRRPLKSRRRSRPARPAASRSRGRRSSGAEDYLVYGRAAGAENIYWKTTNPYLTDTGAAGTAGTPAKATKWAVKNTFELKNAQDVLIEGNVFENIWVADQTGYPDRDHAAQSGRARRRGRSPSASPFSTT